ncbi:glutaredoxin family protein [Pseudonocardia halophobica]|uniref:glutaredoxin family protein n=1 Tax=Pseudonocardia halophobica TaxID=29401 RepID=UPI003D9314F3
MTTTTVQDEEIRVYWKPGCSNCVRLKEYVSKRGFEFTPVNVAADPTGFEVLEKLGAKGLPVLTRGDRYVFGMDLAMVDEILGIETERQALTVAELVERATSVAAKAVELGFQVPKERAEDGLPGRPLRTYGGLANHIVGHLRRLVLVAENPGKSWANVEDYAQAGYQSGTEDIPEPNRTPEDVAERCRDLTARAKAWLATGEDASRPVEIYYGTVPLSQIIESNAYSIVQHTRQLQAVVTFLGYEPAAKLSETDLQNLNLPTALWDEV